MEGLVAIIIENNDNNIKYDNNNNYHPGRRDNDGWQGGDKNYYPQG